jgi:[NiFe] hydrogenase diaphorase moiety small subunit
MDKFTIIIDGKEVEAKAGQTIMEAAIASNIYIPHLCYHQELIPGGHCRVCTVMVNGRPQSACTHPASEGMVIENDTEQLLEERRRLIEMLFVEGNHFCPFCEKQGNCELQALAYRFGMIAPTLPYLNKVIEVDATHPDVYIDRNRCVLCTRCIRASRDLDGKSVFGLEGRGPDERIALNTRGSLSDTQLAAVDRAAELCPTGSIVVKRVGYAIPYGKRKYDREPIGSEIEKSAT